jgi:two-component system sensor histidine kinase/response regulator
MKGETEITIASSKHKILMIEDNSVNVRILMRILKEGGFDILVAESGEQGLQLARREIPHIILLDVVMPGMDGFEVCRLLKEDERTKAIPIIFMTGVSDTASKVKGFELGAVDYVTKPIQPPEVKARINTHLTLSRLREKLQHEIATRGQLISELDTFAHMVAHDLKDPLNQIVGYTSLIKLNRTRMDSEAIDNVLEIISKSGFKMADIIDSLLLLASVHQQDIELQPVPMVAVIREVNSRLNYMIQERKAEIIEPAQWPEVIGYAPWIEEIWANYVSNGLKYGGNPPRLILEATALPDGMVRFGVRDNGEGLAPEKQAELFKPFTRFHELRRDSHGLGLSIVRRIVDKLGGEVGVESQEGEGSLFYFTLPGVSS